MIQTPSVGFAINSSSSKILKCLECIITVKALHYLGWAAFLGSFVKKNQEEEEILEISISFCIGSRRNFSLLRSSWGQFPSSAPGQGLICTLNVCKIKQEIPTGEIDNFHIEAHACDKEDLQQQERKARYQLTFHGNGLAHL